ncbi:hypothetical protein B6U83_01170, partial [Thermoplasmatales archaeon ex4484_36]
IYVDGGEPLDVGNVTVHTLTLSEGEHHLIVEAYDSLNNTAADQVNFTVDLTPPAVHVDAFWGAVNPGESLTIHFSASDNFALSHVVVEVIYLNGTEIEYRYEDNFDRLYHRDAHPPDIRLGHGGKYELLASDGNKGHVGHGLRRDGRPLGEGTWTGPLG